MHWYAACVCGGVLALLTYVTFEHAPYFADRGAVTIVSTQFLRAAAENRCEILTYGFVPDGAHLLIEARDTAAPFVAASRRCSARVFRARMRLRLWDRGVAESILRDAQSARASARYVLSAPVSGSFAWDRLEDLLNSRPRAARSTLAAVLTQRARG